MWGMLAYLSPPLSLDPIREIGIGGGESMLWQESVVLERVVIETFRCIGDESSQIFRWGPRLAGARSQGSLTLIRNLLYGSH